MSEQRSRTLEIVRFAAPFCIIAVGVGGFALLSLLKQKPALANDSKPKRQPVVVVPIVSHEKGVKIKLSGLVVPFREIVVPAEVSGLIASKADFCRAGRYVTAGTELLTLDREEFELSQQEATSSLDELRVDIASTRKLLEIAQKQFEIEQREFKREEKLRGVVADADLDRSRQELLVAENGVVTLATKIESLLSREKRLIAAQRRADLDLERTIIKAPISGVIVGEQIETDMFVQRGASMLVIEDTSKAEVKCNLRKQDLQWLWLARKETQNDDQDDPAAFYEIPKADVRIYYELAGTKFRWSGQLSRYDGIGLDEKTRTIPCRVLVSDPRKVATEEKVKTGPKSGPPALLRGMYVSVEIDARPRVPLFKLPKRAMRPGKSIWLAREGWLFDELAIEEIRIVESTDDGVVVHANANQLRESDRVVVSPLSYPHQGMPIRIKDDQARDQGENAADVKEPAKGSNQK